ncbi:21937_t:CDS:2, partial [Cetraspora pellucida]
IDFTDYQFSPMFADEEDNNTANVVPCDLSLAPIIQYNQLILGLFSATEKMIVVDKEETNPRETSKSEGEKRKAEEQMKEINQAYGVLGDKEKKQRYDAYGSEEAFFRPSGGTDFERFRRSSPIIDEIFSSFMQDFDFRGGTEYWQDRARAANREKKSQPGQDLVFSLPLTQKELISGTKKKVAFSVTRICSRCQQTGTDTKCVICKGQGVINTVQQTFLGNFRLQTTCPRCQGSCPQCLGRKFVIRKKTLEISVPTGLKPNQKVRFRGTGNDSLHGGTRGDVYFVIKVVD